jgi:ribonuclease VapC
VIIDSSALVAILTKEPSFEVLIDAIENAPALRISAGTLLEAAIVVAARADVIGERKLDDLMEAAGIVIEPVTEEHIRIGRAAYRDFGRGSQHPAQLNFGDCFAYALAKTSGEPLLFKGEDFSHTDVRPAV